MIAKQIAAPIIIFVAKKIAPKNNERPATVTIVPIFMVFLKND